MSIASEITRINTNIAAAYTAANGKGATMPVTQNSANLADTIDSISTGGGAVPDKKDVSFYDYDGTLLYSYPFDEAEALSALPALPSHSGLTAQNWTHTLSQIRNAAAAEKKIDVGVVYITDDGCTRLYMHLPDGMFLNPLLSLTITGSLTLSVDWGDGTSPDTVSATRTLTHTWDVSVFPADVVIVISASGTGSYTFSVGTVTGTVYAHMLQHIEIGEKVQSIAARNYHSCYYLKSITIPNNVTSINNAAFQNCYSLKSVTIPNGVTTIGTDVFNSCASLNNMIIPEGLTSLVANICANCYSLESVALPDSLTQLKSGVFQNCYSLRSVTIPSNVTIINENTFQSCYSLESVMIPNGVTTIERFAFRLCNSLKSVTIPNSITSIGNYAFYSCINLYYLDLSQFIDPTALPALDGTMVFFDTPNTMIIWVANQEMLNAFSAATNWSALADRFQIKGA